MYIPKAVDLILVAALALVTASPGRGADRSSTFVTFAARPALATYDIVASSAPRDMVRFVAAVFADGLGLPLPPPVVLRLYSTRAGFREGLVRDVGVSSEVAGELAASALGLALPRSVVLLTAGDDDDRVRLVAHEVMHLVQLELAGPARPAQWMMEGTAEWAALAVLDHLGARDVTRRRRTAHEAARGYLAAHPDFSPASVRHPADFRAWHRRAGTAAYHVAYVLAERLVERHGVPRVMEYFRAFRDTADVAANFERVFTVGTATFIAEALDGMRTAPAPGVPRGDLGAGRRRPVDPVAPVVDAGRLLLDHGCRRDRPSENDNMSSMRRAVVARGSKHERAGRSSRNPPP